MPTKEELLQKALGLQPGDILVFELPYEDAREDDFFPFESLDDFTAMHTAMWIGEGSHPVAHSVRDGYRLPGLRLTSLFPARCAVYRRQGDSEAIQRSAEIMKGWALSSKHYTKEDYEGAFPERFWRDRREKDLTDFFSNGNERISGPSTI